MEMECVVDKLSILIAPCGRLRTTTTPPIEGRGVFWGVWGALNSTPSQCCTQRVNFLCVSTKCAN